MNHWPPFGFRPDNTEASKGRCQERIKGVFHSRTQHRCLRHNQSITELGAASGRDFQKILREEVYLKTQDPILGRVAAFLRGEKGLSSLRRLGEFLVGLQDLRAIPQWELFLGLEAFANITGAAIVGRQGDLEIAEAEKEPG